LAVVVAVSRRWWEGWVGYVWPRTFAHSQCLQHAIDEEHAAKRFAECFDLAHAILVVWFGPVGRECGRDLGEVQHFSVWR
jgi:hypothetical protein